jgi:hypothetical protein
MGSGVSPTMISFPSTPRPPSTSPIALPLATVVRITFAALRLLNDPWVESRTERDECDEDNGEHGKVHRQPR